MTNSSQPPEYSITLNDPVSIPSLTPEQLNALNTINTVSIGSGYYSTTSINTIGINSFTSNVGFDPGEYVIKFPEDWVDRFPDWDRIQTMCNEYPGLKLAFEKFKTTYYLVKDHYDTPEDQRPRT